MTKPWDEHLKWLRRGKRRRLVAEAMYKPMTATQVWQGAWKVDAKVCREDVWRLLADFQRRKLVRCLTPRKLPGRVYYFTQQGLQALRHGLEIAAKPVPAGIDWRSYSFVVLGTTRTAVLCKLSMSAGKQPGRSIESLRQQLLSSYPMHIGTVWRAMSQLKRVGLVESVGVTKRGRRILYGVTGQGKRIAELVML